MTYAELLCTVVMALSMPNHETACKHMDTVIAASHHHKIEPEMLIALIHYESRWVPSAVSRSGACGLTQVLPQYTKPKLTCKMLKDPVISIWEGAKVLNYWVYKYGRNELKIGLCGYNAGFRCKGPNASQKGMRYSRKIKRFYRRILRKLDRVIDEEIPGC